MDEQRRTWKLAAAMAACAVAVILIGVLLVGLRPPVYTSFVEAVGATLTRHGVEYDTIYIDQRWPDTVNNQRYGAHLTILRGGSSMSGRLECQAAQDNCRIWVREFGIEREPIPTLSRRDIPPWLRWIEEQLGWR